MDESEPSAPEPRLDPGADRLPTDRAPAEITLVCSNCWRVSRAPSHGVNEVGRCTRCGARLRVRPPYPDDPHAS